MTQPAQPAAGGTPAQAPPAHPPTSATPPGNNTKAGDPPSTDPSKDDAFKSEHSRQAVLSDLAKERDERQKLAKQLEALAPLQKLADALGASGQQVNTPDDAEQLAQRFSKLEEDLAEERTGRLRAEVGAEKGLTTAQASRLVGKTREELIADADALLALFKPADGSTGDPPRGDPSQGARPGSTPDPWSEGKARAAARFPQPQNPQTTR